MILMVLCDKKCNHIDLVVERSLYLISIKSLKNKKVFRTEIRTANASISNV